MAVNIHLTTPCIGGLGSISGQSQWQWDEFYSKHFSFLGVKGRIILKQIFKKWDGGMDWIDVAQDRDR
jgi:hypothetical protein